MEGKACSFEIGFNISDLGAAALTGLGFVCAATPNAADLGDKGSGEPAPGGQRVLLEQKSAQLLAHDDFCCRWKSKRVRRTN